MTGEDLWLVRVRVLMVWDKMERSLDTETLDTMETKNSTFRETDDHTLCTVRGRCVSNIIPSP